MSAYMQSLTPVPLLHPSLRPMPSQSAKRITSATNSSSAATFEFTRRKKWTDILFSELPDTVLFVLDFNRVIQYANPGASEALGWDVEEMVDMDVLKFINNDDKEAFFGRFQDSLNRRQELFCYSRLKSKATFSNTSNTDRPTTPIHKELLFEIKGHALHLPEHVECSYFFFMAKPYPSRNMAALNTFLECKIENERLTLQFAELKALQHQQRIAASTASSSSAALNVVLSSSTPAGSVLTHVFGRVNMGEDGTMSPTILSASDFASGDAEDEEGGRKKKLKKVHPIDGQHVCVTCGRTDSPEWRKGPKGPKTLCNACGLRWAKRARTKPEEGDPATPSNGQGQGQTGEAHAEQGGPAKGQWPSPYTYVGTSPPTAGGRGARLEPMPNAALSVTPLISSAPGRKPAGRYNKQEQQQQQQQQAGHFQTSPHQIQGNEHVYRHAQEYEQERHDHDAQGGQQHLPLTSHGGHGMGMSMHAVPSTPSSAQVSPIHGQGAHDFVYGGYGSGGQGGDGHAPGASNAGYLSSVSTIVSVDVRGLHPQQHPQQHYAESPTASSGYASAQDRGAVYHEDGGSVHGGYSHALAQAAHWSAASGPGGNPSQHPPQHQQRGAYPGY